MTSKTIEGVGFAAVGPEEDYLLTIAPNGAEDHVYASHLLPSDAKADWAHIEALMGGFGDQSAGILASDYAGNQKPRAYRFRIVVEAVPLSEEETEELLVTAREW